MATYYVRTDGNNANAGTGPTAGQAWQTIQHALTNAILTSGVNTIYIAPGVYREILTVNITPSSTQTVEVVGNPTASLFSGVSAGTVRITNFVNDNTTPSAATVFTCSKTYVTLRNLSFVMYGQASFTNAQYIVIDKCLFESTQLLGNSTVKMTANGTTPINGTITNSIFIGSYTLEICGPTGGTLFDFAISIAGCLFIGQRTILIDSSSQFNNTGGNGVTLYNSTLLCDQGIGLFTTNGTHASVIRNCNFISNGSNSFGIVSQGTSRQSENYNRFSVVNPRSGCDSGANSVVAATGIDWSTSLINLNIPLAIFAPYTGSGLIGAGTSTGAPSVDIYSNAWTSGTDVGAFARTSLDGTGFYYPTERNASAITIAPASTSQSIELYLGATGLAFNTSGLAAYYVRNREAPTPITLVTQTPTGAWSSGGFAEISSSLVPGVYRLDVPNAAFAAGASDVTIVVRGASGTNGAVLTVTLSSGGLTAAQTAAAVWDASRSAYATAGTFGEYVNVNVNSGAIADAVWDEARSGHTTVGTFGQYVNAELVTPVTSAALVRMGPFEVRADGLGASDPLDIQKGAQHGIDIQCVDNNGAGIDITSATVTAKVYNSGATLVDTYACTATYAADGRATFMVDTTVTNTPGTYTATITRSTSANDTQIFGPLRIYVRDI